MRAHGTKACYVFGPVGGDSSNGCRCAECRHAQALYERERSRRITPAYVGAAEVRAHVSDLMAHGVGLKTIAKRSGVAHGTLSKLMYGDQTRGMAPSKRVRPETRDRLLAVTPADAADGARVPAARTWGHVAALLDRGWTRAAIGRAIGQGGKSLQLGRDYVSAANARAVAALLDEPVPPRRSKHGEHVVEIDEDAPPARALDLPTFGLPEPADWMTDAACRRPEVPTWLFFPSRGDHRTVAAAKAVCATCPSSTREACLSFALTHNEPGVWGGTTGNERRGQEVAA